MINQVTLGNTGLRVSDRCMGTMTFGNEADESMSKKLYARCRETGINFFDCANVYAGGESESILGRLIAAERSQVVITSKCFFKFGEGPLDQGCSRAAIIYQVEQSLKRLNTDYIDLYFMHHFDAHTPLEDQLLALDDLVRQGKIRYPAVSNYAAWQVEKALGISARLGLNGLRCIQPMYSLLKRQAEVELLPMAEAEGLGVISYSPLGGGVLTGKYGSGSEGAEGRLKANDMYARRYSGTTDFEVAQDFCALAQELGCHPVALAVAWVAWHPAITAPIIGARNLDQLEPALQSAEVEMDAELYQRIEALTQKPPMANDREEERAFQGGLPTQLGAKK
ncbi:MAG: aldo/keto reductase [Opitutales bacterium]|nr:aldo/keto reductase [Opitutales bacterium]